MPTIRFPDFKKQRLEKVGKFSVKIYHVEFRKNQTDKIMILITFQTLKSGKIFTQSFPVNNYHNSLLHQNLRIWLNKEELTAVKTDDLFGLECRIEIFEKENGYLEAMAIPMMKSKDGD